MRPTQQESSLRMLQKRVLRRLVPHAKRPTVRAQYNRATWWLYAGTKVRCNCCETRFRRFRVYVGDDGHRAQMCPRCGSLGRHRVDWLYLTTRTDALSGPVNLLHIAPEVCLENTLRALPNVNYLSADYDSTLAMDQVDVTNIHYEDNRFDGVICNHVLSVVDDDRRAMSELQRVVKPDGWALVQSSVDRSRETLERGDAAPPSGSSPGDPDRYEEVMMRAYGRDYETRLAEAGFLVTVSDFAKELSPEVQRELGLDLDETIFFCRKPAGPGREPATSQAGEGQAVSN
jgi:SAM-dependent methyltransferase